MSMHWQSKKVNKSILASDSFRGTPSIRHSIMTQFLPDMWGKKMWANNFVSSQGFFFSHFEVIRNHCWTCMNSSLWVLPKQSLWRWAYITRSWLKRFHIKFWYWILNIENYISNTKTKVRMRINSWHKLYTL